MRAKFCLLAVAAAFSGCLSAGVILTTNLAEPNAGSSGIDASDWIAISFVTDSNTYTLTQATLLMSQGGSIGVPSFTADFSPDAPVGNVAELDLYSDLGDSPDSQIATFTDPASISTDLEDNTFTISGVTLSANTTYWVVLKALSGTFSWAFPSGDNGSGVGFTDAYADTGDGGNTWSGAIVGDGPNSAEVDADLASVPEPSTVWLIAAGGLFLMVFRRRLQGTV